MNGELYMFANICLVCMTCQYNIYLVFSLRCSFQFWVPDHKIATNKNLSSLQNYQNRYGVENIVNPCFVMCSSICN